MIQHRAAVLLCVVFMGWSGAAGAAETAQSLALNDAIKRAAERNLDLRIELYNPAQYQADVNRNAAIYDPTLTAQSAYSASNVQTATTSNTTNDSRSLVLNSSVSQLFWSGGTAAVVYNNSYNTYNTSSTYYVNNYWQTYLGLTFSQPLLKNLGRENTDAAITVSRLTKSAALEHYNSRLIAMLAQVRNEYFKLYSLREQLEVRKVSLELARKILADTKARVAAGVQPAMEILNAEFGVASREKDLIDAEKGVSDQNDVLRLLLQLEGKGDIATLDVPRREPLQVNEDEAIRKALTRPDIREQKRNLEITQLQERVNNNKLMPDLSLNASAGLNGLDRTYPRDTDRVASGNYPSWSVGLTLTYPLGNNAAENDYRKSRLKLEQTALQLRNLEESATREVKTALRGVTSGYKQLAVAERGRAYAEERLKAFVRKNEVGLATTKDVLDVENDLATAKNNQISALVTYDNAITQLWLVTGELLEREGIAVSESDADALYRKSGK